jgi:hypothetical protein
VTPEERLRSLYASFNARDIDAVLAATTDDVDWPNAWEGGRVQGHAALRDYWTRQWAEIDPHVEPTAMQTRPDGATAVHVRQVVRNLDGEMVGESDVVHVFAFRDGLISAMTVDDTSS